MRRISLLALAALSLMVGCSDPCEEAGDRITAAYEACGFEISDEDAEDAESECSDKDGELAQCTADCVEAADCGALDGSDTDAALSYGECVLACTS